MPDHEPRIKHTQERYGLRPEAAVFPMMVVLSYVYVCNAKCPNCPYNHSDIRDDYRDALMMPDTIFRRIADECAPHGSLIRLSGGGEPMLHPRAVEHMVYAREKGARIGLITNGSRFYAGQPGGFDRGRYRRHRAERGRGGQGHIRPGAAGSGLGDSQPQRPLGGGNQERAEVADPG